MEYMNTRLTNLPVQPIQQAHNLLQLGLLLQTLPRTSIGIAGRLLAAFHPLGHVVAVDIVQSDVQDLDMAGKILETVRFRAVAGNVEDLFGSDYGLQERDKGC